MSRNLASLFSTLARTRYNFFPKNFSTNTPVRLPANNQRNIFQYGKLAPIQIRTIHVTSTNRALHPVLVLLLRPLSKMMAVLFGRYFRKRWQKLTPEQREIALKKIKSKQTHITAAGTVLAGFTLLYYLEHIEEDPLTKRKKFIIFDDEQMKAISKMEFENQIHQFEPSVVPISHPVYIRVARVANRILAANRDIPKIKDKDWGITVIDRPDITNAAALPEGKILVFSGLLHLCTTDDQLAIVLSHEISHVVCNHSAEAMSRVMLLSMILVIPSVAIWFAFSDVWAFFSDSIYNALTNLIFHLPFTREKEEEADEVGLKLAAKACFDVREASTVWAKFKIVNESQEPPEWASTHPSYERRESVIQENMPIALKIREANNCPRLSVGPFFKAAMI